MKKTDTEIFVHTLIDCNIDIKNFAKAAATDSFICGIASYDSIKGHFVFDDTFPVEN